MMMVVMMVVIVMMMMVVVILSHDHRLFVGEIIRGRPLVLGAVERFRRWEWDPATRQTNGPAVTHSTSLGGSEPPSLDAAKESQR